VETEKSILEKFNDTAKRSNASMSQRSNSQMAMRNKHDNDLQHLMSSYDDKITHFKTKTSIANIPSQTPTRKLGSNTAMSNYRLKGGALGGSPVRIMQNKNEVYD
jgi:hypothetical protein